MPDMLSTDAVLQLAMHWSKADAPANRLAMSLTDDVFHPPMGWSKAEAAENICASSIAAWRQSVVAKHTTPQQAREQAA